MTEQTLRDIADSKKILRFIMPYCFQRISGYGKHVYLPLNRNYKPLGQMDDQWVDYNQCKKHFVVFSSCPSTIEDAWFHIHTLSGEIYTLHMYGDSLDSREGYYDRLANVMSKASRLK